MDSCTSPRTEALHLRALLLRHRLVLAPAGELDLLTTPHLCRVLDAAMAGGHQQITLDLRAVSFADARFAEVVIEASGCLRRRGGSLRIVNAHGSAALVLGLCDVPFRPLSTPGPARSARSLRCR